MPAPPLPVWALVVSIEDYARPRPGWKSVLGAHLDAEHVTDYLRSDMETPEDHIVYLKDKFASRANIISAFIDHLIDNPSIHKGDAILFYYSGHGCFLKAPAGWTVVEEKTGDEELDDMVEAIMPWDEGCEDSTTGSPICAIPDRTLAFLIERAANAHGNNITIVLDCCSSGHGTRGAVDGELVLDGKVSTFVARSVNSDSLTPLPDAEVDVHLAPVYIIPNLEHSSPSTSYTEGSRLATTRYNNRALSGTRGTRFKSLASNHVLLAACGPKESALGDDRNGGVFTRWWMDALRTEAIQPRTYAEILKWVNWKIEAMRTQIASLIPDENKRPPWANFNQHPQCDGVARDKLIFEETMMRGDYSNGVFLPGEDAHTGGLIEITCGSIHGIDVGSIFQLHQLDKNLQSIALLGTAEVTEVEAKTCVARTQQKIPVDVKRCTAIPMRDHLQKLNYVIDRKDGTDAPRDLTECRRILARSSIGVTRSKNVNEVDMEENAELKICFESDGTMTLYRLDSLLKSLTNLPPRLNAKEVGRAEFMEILPGIARFNKLLALTNVTHGPFVDEVTFEMHRLAAHPDYKPGQSEQGFVLREKDKLAQTKDGEIEVQENVEYAIVLRNTTPQALFVQVWYFDPDTYEILNAYEPVNDTQPNLPANGTLQIGASSEVSEPLEFFLPLGASRNTLFAKVYVTDTCTKLTLLHQGALIGEDWEGTSNILKERKDEYDDRADNKADVQTTSMWNTILQKITVVRRQK